VPGGQTESPNFFAFSRQTYNTKPKQKKEKKRKKSKKEKEKGPVLIKMTWQRKLVPFCFFV